MALATNGKPKLSQAEKKTLSEMVKAGTWSGKVVLTKRKPLTDLPIFKQTDNQLTLF